MNEILSLENIYAGYGKMLVIQGVTLKLKEKEIALLIGPNGSGKSTLIKTIFKLSNIFKGKIYYQRKDITFLPPEEVARMGIGYVPQINNVFNNLTVQENLEMGFCMRQKISSAEVREDLEYIFNLFPILRERLRQKAKTLSGGERQMLAIARALIGKPKILILDEPMANLAPKIAFEILKVIEKIREKGTTILIVSQLVKRILEIADRVHVLVSGRKVYEGDGYELLSSNKLERLFLGIT